MMSKIEEMLSALRQRASKPKLLPGLPPRPAVRGRLPSQKRSLPIDFQADETDDENSLDQHQEMALRLRVLGTMRMTKSDEPEESPYAEMEDITNYKWRWGHDYRLDSAMTRSPLTELLDEKFRWHDTTDITEKKVFLIHLFIINWFALAFMLSCISC